MSMRNLSSALVLALAAGTAAAGPVVFEHNSIAKGAIADSYVFDVTTPGNYSGLLQTYSKQDNDVQLTSVLLQQGGLSYAFTKSLGFNDLGKSIEIWSLPLSYLQPGNWTLSVTGADTNSKAAGSYNVALSNAVPEPESLALVGAALLGLAWVRRQRKPS